MFYWYYKIDRKLKEKKTYNLRRKVYQTIRYWSSNPLLIFALSKQVQLLICLGTCSYLKGGSEMCQHSVFNEIVMFFVLVNEIPLLKKITVIAPDSKHDISNAQKIYYVIVRNSQPSSWWYNSESITQLQIFSNGKIHIVLWKAKIN